MESLSKLKKTLTSMLEVHQQLLDLASEKQAILIEGKVPELEKVVSKEGKLSGVIQVLEQEREQQVQEFFLAQGQKTGNFTLTQLIDNVKDPIEKLELMKNMDKLKKIVSDISYLNKNNQQLIQMTLSYIQYSMNILMPREPTIGYGKKSAASSVRFLDAKI